ncbi:MAG: hypothetical protein JXR48_01920 [Candidatus Delongbacteria bacterium]|nr:hypothetical protein [Candidatus Delongbacteria bacterium]
MKNKNHYLIMLFIILTYLSSCTEIFETNITDSEVTLLSPIDSLSTYDNLHLFLWEEVEGANEYNLRIVRPSFANIENIILDTIITQTQFNFSLNPGIYQWGVKASNVNYETSYTIWNINIDTVNDLSLLTTSLNAPINNYMTNNTEISFSWNSIYGADTYYYEVIKTDWETGELQNAGFTENTYANVSLTEGVYFWGVKALDNYSQTETFYSVRSFTIDTTIPEIPILIEPANNDTISENTLELPYISFKWIRNSENSTPTSDSIRIFSDENLENEVFSALVSDTTYSYAFTQYGKYYWYVRSIDAAGNISTFNTNQIRTFVYEE